MNATGWHISSELFSKRFSRRSGREENFNSTKILADVPATKRNFEGEPPITTNSLYDSELWVNVLRQCSGCKNIMPHIFYRTRSRVVAWQMRMFKLQKIQFLFGEMNKNLDKMKNWMLFSKSVTKKPTTSIVLSISQVN